MSFQIYEWPSYQCLLSFESSFMRDNDKSDDLERRSNMCIIGIAKEEKPK